ncbi:FtsX-like permease family protein [Streptomyces sp. MI02-7b]|uniref:FtsX-like permease family protein n=1 Tax=Streptomyces sp. MI02-7b TaxID=462941 RepID=UPI0029A15325|nr:FtsX-like permease family protein [Streptomyces sp. MI02-7b]MDX3070846.1 ABC transporter permease [Streptomyces sp. MI02-7b]
MTVQPTPSRHGDVSWIRARLRTAPGGAVALAALVLVTAFLAAALPRAVDTYENGALRDTLRQAPLTGRTVTISLPVSQQAVAQDAEGLLTPQALAATEEAFRHVVRPPLALDWKQTVLGVRNAEATPLPDPRLPRPTANRDPRTTLIAQADLAAHSRVITGRLPRPGGQDGVIEAVITDRTAKTMRLDVGARLHLPTYAETRLTLRITGIVEPQDPGGTYWNAEPDLRAPKLVEMPVRSGETPPTYWHFSALIDPAATAPLLDLRNGALAYWHHVADIDAFTARDVPAVRDRVFALNSGPDATRLQALTQLDGLTVEEDGLAGLLTPFLDERAAAQPLVLIAVVGVGTVAFVVLLMAAGLQTARRRAELTLLRARGIALPALAARLLAESAVVAVPSAALGLGLALLVVPTERWAPAAVAAAAVAVTACLGLPLRGAAVARRPRLEQREDLVAARPSRRRNVAELTVAVVVAGAVTALRVRGTADDGADVLTAAAPVLVAVLAALVLLRVYPLPVRLLARPAARLNSAVLHIGVARAGRAPSTAALPLLAVLVALTVTSFGGSVLAGVAAGRDHAAIVDVGADARVQSYDAPLPAGLDARVRHLRGVRDTVGVQVESGQVVTGSGITYDTLIVDPESYARLIQYTGMGGPFPSRALADDGQGPVPVIASPRLAGALGDGTVNVNVSMHPVPAHVVGTVATSPAVYGSEFVIVSEASVRRARPVADAVDAGPTTLLITGADVDGAALRAAVRAAAPGARVLLRSEERSAWSTTALQSGARGVYLAAVAAGAGYSVLALLLSLMHNAPQRRALLARLRTMGMTGRQRQTLAVLEMLPQVLLGAVGGILVSVATVPLLRPGVDLTALAFSTSTPATDVSAAVLRTDPASLLLPSAALVALACAVLAVQAWATGRRGEGTELRIGDRA